MYAKNDEVIWSFCNKCRKHLLCDVEIIKLGNLFPKKKINSFLSKISYLKIYKLFTIEDENRTVKMTISSAWGDSVNGEVRNIVKSSLCVDDGVQRCEAKRNELFWSFRQSKISSFCKPKPSFWNKRHFFSSNRWRNCRSVCAHFNNTPCQRCVDEKYLPRHQRCPCVSYAAAETTSTKYQRSQIKKIRHSKWENSRKTTLLKINNHNDDEPQSSFTSSPFSGDGKKNNARAKTSKLKDANRRIQSGEFKLMKTKKISSSKQSQHKKAGKRHDGNFTSKTFVRLSKSSDKGAVEPPPTQNQKNKDKAEDTDPFAEETQRQWHTKERQ